MGGRPEWLGAVGGAEVCGVRRGAPRDPVFPYSSLLVVFKRRKSILWVFSSRPTPLQHLALPENQRWLPQPRCFPSKSPSWAINWCTSYIWRALFWGVRFILPLLRTSPHPRARSPAAPSTRLLQRARRSSSPDDAANYGLGEGLTHKAEGYRAINTDVVTNTEHSDVYLSVLARSWVSLVTD